MKNWNKIIMGCTIGALATNLWIFRVVFPKSEKKWKRDVYDCAVVCGYPATDAGSPSSVLKSRVEKAVMLWKQGKIKNIIMSGAAVANGYTEAAVMCEYAMSLGVPKKYIFREEQAVSTYHNLLYAKKIMEEQKFRNCVVITNDWHIRKANHYAEKFQLDYVMSVAKRPDGETKIHAIRKNVWVNLHMYLEFLGGLY